MCVGGEIIVVGIKSCWLSKYITSLNFVPISSRLTREIIFFLSGFPNWKVSIILFFFFALSVACIHSTHVTGLEGSYSEKEHLTLHTESPVLRIGGILSRQKQGRVVEAKRRQVNKKSRWSPQSPLKLRALQPVLRLPCQWGSRAQGWWGGVGRDSVTPLLELNGNWSGPRSRR